jgi:uncharacterized phage-associated protein
MPYSAKAVANYLLDLAESNDTTIDPLKMQKLVYFAHGWHLTLEDAPLIRETVQAWTYGPVIPVLFHEFKRWGGNPIREHATEITAIRKSGGGLVLQSIEPSLDAECVESPEPTKALLRRVWDVYRKYSGTQLSTMTHASGSPWAKVREQQPDRRDVEIPDDLIKQDFARRARQNAPIGIATT